MPTPDSNPAADETDSLFDAALGIFGAVTDGLEAGPYTELEPPEGPEHEAGEGPGHEAPGGVPMDEYFGPELASYIDAKVAEKLSEVKSMVAELVRAELRTAFAPIRAHNEAMRAKLAAAEQAKADGEFAVAHPRYSEPAVQAGVQENMSKYPGMDKSTAYKLTISLLPAQDLVAQAAMPGMGSPMPNKPAATPKTTMDSWFSRKTK